MVNERLRLKKHIAEFVKNRDSHPPYAKYLPGVGIRTKISMYFCGTE
jgi:uncharacterized protein (UPF0305 family)